MIIKLFLTTALAMTVSSLVQASTWPEAPWLNGQPKSSAALTAVGFASPFDLQFNRLLSTWKKLEKKYSYLNVDFLLVSMPEPKLSFNESLMQSLLKEFSYNLPVLLDPSGNYSKLWRAYVTPTVNLVARNGRVTNFDPGAFDPATFEKTLQKLLKENGVANLPSREFTNDGEAKMCGHSHTTFLGVKYQRAWNSNLVLASRFYVKDFWLEKRDDSLGVLEIPITRSGLGILAESDRQSSRVNITLDGKKVPGEFRGRDLSEDKTGQSFVTIRGLKNYEIIAHSQKMVEGTMKINITTNSQNIKLWALQTLPSCMDN